MLGARALGSPGPPAPLGGPGRPLLRPAAAGDGDHPSKQSPRFSLGWLQNLTSTAKSDFADIADLADMADFSLEVQFVKTAGPTKTRRHSGQVHEDTAMRVREGTGVLEYGTSVREDCMWTRKYHRFTHLIQLSV